MELEDGMEEIRTKKGTMIERPDGTRISGFIKGKMTDENPRVWCVNCRDEIDSEKGINPVIESIVEMDGSRAENNMFDLTCSVCSSNLPAD